MLRSAVVIVGAVVLMAGATACGAPTTAVSQPSSIPSSVSASSAPMTSSAPSPVASAAVVSAPASSPVAAQPRKPVGSPPQDVGDLEQFAQVSATTWWATVVGNLSNQLFLVRTVDAGQHWQDVTPSGSEFHVSDGVSSDVLSADVAWVAADAGPATPQLFRTTDGGQSWQQMGTVPTGCTLQFVDPLHGWCWAGGAAAGSEAVSLYSTQDAGATWHRVSRTTGDGTEETVDHLPFGCDKSLTFTSQTVGWASSFCAGGQPYLGTSKDGGARWHAVSPVPFAATADLSEGVGLSVPAVDGEDIAVVDLGGLGPGASAVATSSNNGVSWRLHPLPAAPTHSYWNVDLIDPTHWRATDGDMIICTDDAGAHWSRWTPAVPMHDQYGTLQLDFISPEVGAASDPADRTPLWSTTDGGKTWTKVVIDAGPYVLQ
jgi:photosystem II stability/assembly factor-like uncharacterized protein